MAEPSSKITGNDDAAGADPGGTRSTKPGQLRDGQRVVVETVTSGDRNEMTKDPTKPDKGG